MAEKNTGKLGDVYAATSPDQVAAHYDAWAAEYEGDMARAGYRHPAIATALLARHLPAGAGPILDAGCGTGLAGEWLGILGYPEVHGLDLSQGMLARAEAKGAYAALHRVALGGPLPFATGGFAGALSAGVFTTGHVGTEALPELVRILRPGAVFVLTVKDTLWTGGFSDAVDRHAELRVLEATAPYVSMPGEAGTAPSRAVVLGVGQARTRAPSGS